MNKILLLLTTVCLWTNK